MTMEFIGGGCLSARIANLHRPPPSLTVHDLARARRAPLEQFPAVCDAIAIAHSRGILHLDLKPANVLFRPNRMPVVSDWGAVREPGTKS